MANIIACRVASYGKYQDRAWRHLPEIGITHVEVPVPPTAYVAIVRNWLSDHGLKATSLQAFCDIAHEKAVDAMKPQLEACSALGARICFVSIRAGETECSVVWKRLRAIGDEAAQRGITVAMETHPDLITNGSVAAETMRAIDHPNVRVNFDTANIYFYNEGLNTISELEKVIDWVGAVHLKDTTGGYQEWNFPALGTGVVDLGQVIQMMNARGFTGPFTIELEGTKGIEKTETEHLQYIADSVAYLRTINAFG